MEKAIARLSFDDASNWTPARRKMVAEWLRKHAEDLLKEGDNYSKRFRGKFFVETD